MAIQFAENYYTFRVTEQVLGTILHPQAPDQAALAAIEAKLVEANNDFLARRYQDAISAYNAAASLIYAQLDPGFPAGFHRGDLMLSRDPALFKPLLSAALEWMNVLPVRQPIAAVRPRLAVDPSLLAQSAQLDRTGVVSSKLASPASAGSVADWQLAQVYTGQGNTDAAKFFSDRAASGDPHVYNLLTGPAPEPTTPAGPVTPAPPSLPHVGGPVIPVPPSLPHVGGPLLGGGLVRPLDLSAAPLADAIRVRLPAAAESGLLGSLLAGALVQPSLPAPVTAAADRSFGTMIGEQVVSFAWQAGAAPPLDQVTQAVYAGRIQVKDLGGLVRKLTGPADVALDLPHDYYYVIPLGLAECYHALGDYVAAETHYFQAAAYQFLNTAIEAPYLWQRLATLYLDWGDSLFREDQAPDALAVYQHVLIADGSAPNSTLYTTASLTPGANAARTVIGSLAGLIKGQTTAAALGVNPALAAPIVEVYQQITKIQGGLDFWGFWHASVPIWTFDFLQSTAINFTQLAISAERDMINFWDRADQATLTRQQIAQNVAQGNAEVQATQLQANAAAAEVDAYNDALALTQKRAADAAANAAEYATKSAAWIVHQAQSTQLSGGDDGNSAQLNRLADQMMSGHYDLSDGRGTLAAAEQLTGARLNREYEIDTLNRQTTEMNLARTQAQAELVAAHARLAAAQATVAVAQLRAQAAQENLTTFDNQIFTPDVWYKMGETMRRLYRRYLNMALRIARMMQQAYNFETDQSLKLIKGDYATDEVKGMLAAEALMADIQTFTYDLITSRTSKPQPLRQTISLAERYGFAFETQLRRTGVMEFQTRIDDFDAYYPGTYAGRIEAVEIEVDGIVPVSGISGSLTNSGVSAYRTPASLWTNPSGSGLKFRVQSKETLVLSDYAARQDALLIQSDQRLMHIFQGAGLASTWRLELPKAINDIDFGALTDVRITFYYKARYDPDLAERVKAQLAARPGINARQRGIPLRWVYPDAFFHFQDTGELAITIRAGDFRRNETNPVLTTVGVQVVTDGSMPASGLRLSLATPGRAAAAAQTDAEGVVESDAPASPWTGLAGGSAVGDYLLAVRAADNPAWSTGGTLNLAPIVNVALVLGYSFTPRA